MKTNLSIRPATVDAQDIIRFVPRFVALCCPPGRKPTCGNIATQARY